MKKIIIEIYKCGKICPYWRYSDGMGHTDEYIMCDNKHKEIKWWKKDQMKDDFPIWCPLDEENIL